MSGSDLDGDEYAVIWDDQLYFGKNHEPMEFPQLSLSPEEEKMFGEGVGFYLLFIYLGYLSVIFICRNWGRCVTLS